MNDEEFAYLRDGFNPNKLRKDQLRNVLLLHDVNFSSSMLKSELVELFETNIVPRRAELRKRFIAVAPPSESIVDATISPRKRTTRNEKEYSANSKTEQPQSSETHSRLRSPRRVISNPKQESIEAKSGALKSGAIPKLSPTSLEFPELPKSPASPRRRRATRKVAAPSEDPEPLKVPDIDEIKIKSNRSPRKKRPAEREIDNNQGLASNNTLQRDSHQPKRAHLEQSHEDTQPLTELDPLVPFASSNISGEKVPFDDKFVADLNAEMARYDEQQQQFLYLDFPENLEFEKKDGAAASTFLEADPSTPSVSNVSTRNDAKSQRETSEKSKQTDEHMRSSTSDTPSQSPADFPDAASKDLPLSTPSSASVARRIENTPATRRRGFLPSLSELNVSQAFAEQLEPFMAATPAPTPKSPTPRLDASNNSLPPSRSITPSVNLANAYQSDSESFFLHDAETEAAETVHTLVENIPSSPIFRLRLPRMHIRFPRFRVSRFKCSFSTLLSAAGTILLILSLSFSIMTLVLAGAIIGWYRTAYESAEFCGVGVQTPHVYPHWTTANTGSSILSHFQSLMRESMDEAWPDCIPCPENAHCYQNQIALCDSGYIKSPHSLSWMGLWPFPPKCIPDWETQRKLDVLSERAAVHLRESYADVLCGPGETPTNDEDLARASALSTTQLRSKLLDEKSELLSDEEFDDLWQQVIDLLPTKYSDVYVVSDPFHILAPSYIGDNNFDNQMLTNTQTYSSGDSCEADTASSSEEHSEQLTTSPDSLADHIMWLASNSDEQIPLKCRLRLTLWGWIRRHRRLCVNITAFIMAVLLGTTKTISWLRRRRLHKQMVESFKTQLRNQRTLAANDPSGKTPQYLRTTELRRQVSRADWPRIQAEVESAEEVRARQIEVYGEIMRIWEWAI